MRKMQTEIVTKNQKRNKKTNQIAKRKKTAIESTMPLRKGFRCKNAIGSKSHKTQLRDNNFDVKR